MLGMTASLLMFSPVVLVGAAIADIIRGRRKFPTVRLALFAMQYAINDSAEILLAPCCGSSPASAKASTARHQSPVTNASACTHAA